MNGDQKRVLFIEWNCQKKVLIGYLNSREYVVQCTMYYNVVTTYYVYDSLLDSL